DVGTPVVGLVPVQAPAVVTRVGADPRLVAAARQGVAGVVEVGRVQVEDAAVDVLLPPALPPLATAGVARGRQVDLHTVPRHAPRLERLGDVADVVRGLLAGPSGQQEDRHDGDAD